METILYNIINNLWPEMLLVSVITITFRLTSIVENKTKVTFQTFIKDIVMLCFINYVIALFYIVSFQDVDWSTYNIVPFKEILRYTIGSPLFYKNILGNMVMFMPFGLAIPFILKVRKTRVIILLSFLTSITIEVTQLAIGRVFDVDDVLLNLIGALLGYLIYMIFYKIFKVFRGKHE